MNKYFYFWNFHLLPLLFLFFFIFYEGEPPKAGLLCVPTSDPCKAPPPPHELGKTRLCCGRGPKKLFAPKGIRTLDLMGMPSSPRSSPLEPTPWSFFIYFRIAQTENYIIYHGSKKTTAKYM
jgi:hypothetical protein